MGINHFFILFFDLYKCSRLDFANPITNDETHNRAVPPVNPVQLRQEPVSYPPFNSSTIYFHQKNFFATIGDNLSFI